MSHQGYVARCLDSILILKIFYFIFKNFLYICNFPNHDFLQNDKRYACYFQRLCLVDKLIVLLKENTARDPEFDFDRSELAVMDYS